MNNPLLHEWESPYKLPPFDLIKAGHFKPAIEKSIEMTRDEINKITRNPANPSFSNTVEPLDKAGTRLDEITSILFNLNSAETNRDIQAAAREVSPILSRFQDEITLNRKLFERLEEVHRKQSSLKLNKEQEMLLKKTYRSFMKGGAGIEEARRERFRQINQELASLSLKFEENVLEETNAFFLHINDEADLEGLPDGIIETASEEAKNSGREGWIFTLHLPSYIPFMQYSARRDLRERMYRAYSSRAYRKKRNDNRKIVEKIVKLRKEKAVTLGFKNYAEFVLGDRMLDSPGKVIDFLEELHMQSREYALRDLESVRAYAANNNHSGELERWDWQRRETHFCALS